MRWYTRAETNKKSSPELHDRNGASSPAGIRVISIYFCCSSRDLRIQGSGVGNCSVGTPSSNSLERAAEKLTLEHEQWVCLHLLNPRGQYILLEPDLLAISVWLSILLEALVLGENIIRTAHIIAHQLAVTEVEHLSGHTATSWDFWSSCLRAVWVRPISSKPI